MSLRSPLSPLFRQYFYSGWAFLIPYLALYLLYYATGWPVNVAAVDTIPSQGPAVIGQELISHHLLPIPPLLHVYWLLHAIHMVLAGFALWSWWKERSGISQLSAGRSQKKSVRDTTASQSTEFYSLPATHYSLLTKLAPWALLALIFYIPGVYLEWPSDPWEHLRRINEWRTLNTVSAHSSWHKSAYFIPYSFLSWCIGLRQLFWLDFYYTGICLLLCWQYYRLARACGLGERASMVVVILQALLFGNNIFSFYRYYGISSSTYAQLGAITLTRLVLEWAARGKIHLHREDAGNADTTPGIAQLFSPSVLRSFSSRPSFWHLPSVLWLLAACFCLVALTAFNHQQGVAIAGIAILAIGIWRLLEFRHLLPLIISVLAASMLTQWLIPKSEALHSYQTQGALTSWYGFNIFNINKPAGDRMIQIVSATGLINIAVAFWLLRKNSVIAWLTLTPLLVLVTPCFSLPMAALFVWNDPHGLHIFQRMLFALPPYFALTAFIYALTKNTHRRTRKIFVNTSCAVLAQYILLPAILVSMLLVSPETPGYSRLWHTLHSTPQDLKMSVAWKESAVFSAHARGEIEACTYGLGSLKSALIQSPLVCEGRTGGIPAAALDAMLKAIHSPPPNGTALTLVAPISLNSTYSFAAITSRHWLPQELSGVYAGTPELVRFANENRYIPVSKASLSQPVQLFLKQSEERNRSATVQPH